MAGPGHTAGGTREMQGRGCFAAGAVLNRGAWRDVQ